MPWKKACTEQDNLIVSYTYRWTEHSYSSLRCTYETKSCRFARINLFRGYKPMHALVDVQHANTLSNCPKHKITLIMFEATNVCIAKHTYRYHCSIPLLHLQDGYIQIEVQTGSTHGRRPQTPGNSDEALDLFLGHILHSSTLFLRFGTPAADRLHEHHWYPIHHHTLCPTVHWQTLQLVPCSNLVHSLVSQMLYCALQIMHEEKLGQAIYHWQLWSCKDKILQSVNNTKHYI